MPETAPHVLHATALLDQLKQCGVTHIVWLPDTETSSMHQAITQDGSISLVPVTREGETMAIAAGLIAGGARPVVLIQSTGFFESGDSIRGVCLDIGLPLLMLLGYRGFEGAGGRTGDSAAVFLEPILNAWGIGYQIVADDEDLPRVSEEYKKAWDNMEPRAILVGREYGEA